MGFDEAGFGDDLFQIIENRVEPLDVADLEDAVVSPGQLDQLRGLGRVAGHGFFDQNMFAAVQEFAGDIEVGGGGRDDVERIAGCGGFGNRPEHPGVMFCGDLAGSLKVRIEDTGQDDSSGGGQFGVDADMVLPEGSGA